MALKDIRKRLATARLQTRVRRVRTRAPSANPPPLFIIGSGRSGNTLVRRTLMNSGQIYIPPETFVLGEVIEKWDLSRALPWRERVWLFCAYFEKHKHFPTFELPNLNAFAKDATEMAPAERSLRNLIVALYGFFAKEHGYAMPRWGDKSPWNTFHLETIKAFFPEAQFLWLVRDGRDAALSYAEAEFYDGFPTAARRWVRANADCAALAGTTPALMQMKYEAIVTSPEAEFRRLFDWLGMTFSPDYLSAQSGRLGDVDAMAHHRNVKKPISAASVGRWREMLSPEDLRAAGPDFAAMLAQLGYDT